MENILDLPPLFVWLLIVSPLVGSFLGVVILRLPIGQPVVFGRSACPSCNTELSPFELVPVFSWFLLRRRCRNCGRKISFFYPLIELGALVIVLWAALQTQGRILVASCILGWVLLALAVIDARTLKLPNSLTYSLLASGLVATTILTPDAIVDHLIGAALGYLSFSLVSLIYVGLRGRHGLGLGDAKLLAAIGAWVSWEGLVSVVLIASVVALIWLVILCLRGHEMRQSSTVPFGPFLALAGWIVWLYGPVVFAV